MDMNWIKITDRLPEGIKENREHRFRVLTFSPAYPENSEMRYRMMDCEFVKMCKEVTRWVIPEPPKD